MTAVLIVMQFGTCYSKAVGLQISHLSAPTAVEEERVTDSVPATQNTTEKLLGRLTS